MSNFRGKKTSDFRYHVDYTDTQNKPCLRSKCMGFMFKVLVRYWQDGPTIEEWECWQCKKTQQISVVTPKRRKKRKYDPRQFSRKSGHTDE